VNRTRLIFVALTTVLLASACDAGSKDNDSVSTRTTAAPAASSSTTTAETSTTTSPKTTNAPTTDATTATTAAPATSVPAGGADCLSGEWKISEIAASDASITVSGNVAGMTMTFGTGTWALRATNASIPAKVSGTTATVSLDGAADGKVATLGDRLQFTLDNADGTASASAGGRKEDLDFEEVIVALGPSGAATSTCSATAATLTTSTTTIDLTR
jgi:hypothetical protein